VEFALEQLTARKAMAATMAMCAVAAVAIVSSFPSLHATDRTSAGDPAVRTLTVAVPGLAPFQDVRFGLLDRFGDGPTTASVRARPDLPVVPRELLNASLGSVPVSAAAYGYREGRIRDLVVRVFGLVAGGPQVLKALCVAHRESRFHVFATNRSSGAAGLFQWLPHSWRVYSHRYGLDGASPYDPVANVTVAAHVVADDGWGPWAGPGC